MTRLKLIHALCGLWALASLPWVCMPVHAADNRQDAATPAASGAIDPAKDMAKLADLISRLQSASAGSEDFAAVANEVGPVIDELRQAGLDAKQLDAVRRQLEQMRTLAEQRLDRYEADTNENEAALESMYRSRIWDDMSFALAAFPYWRAWIDLELARMVTGQGEKSQALKPARSGFKAASVQLFKPGLVYGGWLGLGYVELEGGRKDRAKEIFKKLEEALASEPDSPVRQAVSMELRMLDAKQGTVSRFAGKGGKYSDNDAPLIKNEAFAMLQQSRKTGGRPLEAAARLKAVIDASKIDDQLLSNMMTYAQELSGVDVGPYTDLAGAEFAMANEHWYNAMQKYAAFFKAVQPPADLDLSNYRYRWALAAYKSDIFEPAIDVLNKLLSNPRLSGELDEAGSKLLYAIYATRAQRGASEANQQKLREAAARFVSRSPHDPAADAARLMIAQTSRSAGDALQQLGKVSSAEAKAQIGRTAFGIIARDFSAAVARGKTAQGAGLARQGIDAWQTLPPEDKKDQFNFAVLLEMRSLVDPDPDAVLKALDQIEQKGKLNNDIERALVWSRLQLFDRMKDPAKSEAYVAKLAGAGIAAWQVEYLYPWIRDRKDIDQRMKLARLVRPAVKDQPEMDRRFAMLIIEDLLTKKDATGANEQARAFLKQYPKSGDAWRLVARSSEAVQQPFEADRAWNVITDKAVPTMPIWWEGMLSRVRIRTQSNRPDEACPLLKQLVKQQQYVPAEFKDELNAARGGAQCATTQAAN
jgi:hypothetical protein